MPFRLRLSLHGCGKPRRSEAPADLRVGFTADGPFDLVHGHSSKGGALGLDRILAFDAACGLTRVHRDDVVLPLQP